MELINKRLYILIILFLFMGMGQWAQSPSPGYGSGYGHGQGPGQWPGQWPWQFGTEILNLEQKLANPGISVSERYEALVRLARLRQLSGNIPGAAANWLDAAAINPNDDNALVAGAYCLAAIGEWERAFMTIQPLIASTRRSPAVLQAFYLDAYLKTWSYANASPLVVLAADPGFASLRPMVYFTIWQILTRNPNVSGAGNADSWKARLIAEYPGSPEALIAGSRNPSISAVQSPMWLLFPGAPVSGKAAPSRPPASATQSAPAQAVPIPQVVPAPNTVTPIPKVVVPPPAPTAPPPVVHSPVNAAPALQTGVFGSEANARSQVEALRKAGFTATISRKPVNGAERWAVTVPAGQNTNKTIQDLKKAGFDSFPVK